MNRRISGAEYVNGILESIYHSEGRLHYVNGTPQMEYQTSDHLGNTRLVYADLDNDGIINTPSEILDEVHYYPNGLKMEGYWMNSQRFRYTFNGIEELDDFGLNVNHATFRVLDPELGRWWSVDPDATMFGGLSPYNSMFNSPIVHSDPNGDNPLLIGAGIGFLMNGVNNLRHGQNFFQGGFEAAVVGGLQAGISSGIGTVAQGLANAGWGALGVATFQAGAHGLTGGAFSAAQGGSFGQGAAAGGIASGVSSGITSLGGGSLAQWIGGGLSGGISSAVFGGNVTDGLTQGLITSGLNHAAETLQFQLTKAKLTKLAEGAGLCTDCSQQEIGQIFENIVEAHLIRSGLVVTLDVLRTSIAVHR